MRIFLVLVITSLLNVSFVQTSHAQSPSISQVTKKSYNGSDVSCNGNKDAELTVVPSPGQGTLTYSMNGGAYQVSNVFSNLASGHYYFVAKNALGNVSNRIDIDVSTPNTLIISSLFNTGGTWGGNVSCYGSSDGSFGITTTGGTGSVLASKDNGANYQSAFYFDKLAVGTYMVKIKDVNGCMATGNYTVNGPTPISATFNQTSFSCSSSQGTVVVTPAGGSPNYTYNVDNGSTGWNTTLSNLNTGNHTVKITDNHSCTSIIPFSVNVIQPVAPAISYAGTPFCNSLTSSYNATQTGTTGGTYTSSPAGLNISASGGIIPSKSTPGTYTVTYTVAASGQCLSQVATTTIAVTQLPSASITYTAAAFCNSASGNQSVKITGTPGGTFSAPTGLIIDQKSGAITPLTSTPGTYTVTYTLAATGGCTAQTTTTNVTITQLPSAKIAYSATMYCTSESSNQNVVITGTSSGTFTASPAGLSINATNGIITPSTSKAASYSITYTMAGSGGCSVQTATTNVAIIGAPSATISYNGTPFCNSLNTTQNVTMSGTSGGSYSAPTGLSINNATGAIDVFSSTPGNYSVTYTVSKIGLITCPATTSTTPVVITAVPGATISYANAPFCSTDQLSKSVVVNGTTGGNFSSKGLSINAATGAIVPGQNGVGNYTISYNIPASGGCASFATTTSIYIGTPGTWTGKMDNNWDNVANWICGLPNTNIDAYIPNSAPLFPTVSSNTASAKNLTIDAGASLTVVGSLQIAGYIGNKGTFDATQGTLVFTNPTSLPATGAASQTISASWFVNKTINNLTISNTKGLNLYSTLNDTLNVTGILSFGVGNTTFNTNNNLTLKSTANGTASVADITNNGAYKGNTITGNVTVERFINMGTQPGQHNKAWVMVSTPTQGESIYQSWMENGNKTIKGFGTQITGNGTGFDAYSAGPALKYYNDANNTWTPATNTSVPVYNPLGYILFVRGDRTTTYPNISNTTLRTTGTLLCGTSIPVAVKGGKFQSVGNPYASAVDIRKMSTTNVNPDIIVWDPTLTTGNAYGLGAYQTLYKDGTNYRNLLTSDAYGNAGTVNNNIQSGVAFFVQSFNTDGQVYFTESAKATNGGQGIAMRAQGDTDNGIALKTTLYVMNPDSTSFVTDGTMEQFSTDYNNGIDGMDTRKLANTSENLSIRDQGNYLVIDRRNYLTAADTITYNLTGVTNRNYRLIFSASNLNTMGVTGFIEDTYTNTKTPLNADGDTQLDFTVSSVAGSKVANRFNIVFKTLITMPVTFTSIKASAAKTTISVDWTVENQKNLKEYDVERSADGNSFSQVGVVAATNASSAGYNWVDQNPFSGNNYYRIKSVDLDGKVAYTSVVKAQIGGISTSMDVYPNPAINANVNIRFNNEPAGVYYARLLNQLGQVVVSKKIVVNAGNSTENIEWNKNAARGIYNLEITMPDGGIKAVKIVY